MQELSQRPRDGHIDVDAVPELTRSASIQLNKRILLWRRGEKIVSSRRTLSHVRSVPSKAVGRSYSARRLCFEPPGIFDV